MQVYVGYDQREKDAYDVAVFSMKRHSRKPVSVIKLETEKLRSCGLYTRPTDKRGGIYDLHSNAPCSTDFALTRFLVPILAQTGFALFIDCDMLFLADVEELFACADPRYAVQVVKHRQTGTGTKMDNCVQLEYPCKNWSSVCLFNMDHPANARLSLRDVNERPGRALHSFYWLNNSEIGDLPAEWNWLVNVEEKPSEPKLAHYTLGGPFTPGWKGAEYDSLWLKEFGVCREYHSTY